MILWRYSLVTPRSLMAQRIEGTRLFGNCGRGECNIYGRVFRAWHLLLYHSGRPDRTSRDPLGSKQARRKL